MANSVKTVLLLGLLTGLIMFLGSFWGERGITMALVMSVLMNFGSYFFSDKIALGMAGAKPVNREQAPRLYSMVENLCSRSGIPMPKVYVIPEDSPNAFATGRNPEHASVAVTEGALKLLDENELQGVLAHEISHVKNRDILISSIAAALAGVIMWIANIARFGVLFGGGGHDREEESGGALGGVVTIIVAPIAALLIQTWISRTREYQADSGGAELAGSPYGLISALQKLDSYSKRLPMEVSPSSAHMYIVHPFSGSAIANLFSTHPPTQKRVQHLRDRI